MRFEIQAPEHKVVNLGKLIAGGGEVLIGGGYRGAGDPHRASATGADALTLNLIADSAAPAGGSITIAADIDTNGGLIDAASAGSGSVVFSGSRSVDAPLDAAALTVAATTTLNGAVVTGFLFKWIGATDDFWQVTSNWNRGVLPGRGDTVVIDDSVDTVTPTVLIDASTTAQAGTLSSIKNISQTGGTIQGDGNVRDDGFANRVQAGGAACPSTRIARRRRTSPCSQAFRRRSQDAAGDRLSAPGDRSFGSAARGTSVGLSALLGR